MTIRVKLMRHFPITAIIIVAIWLSLGTIESGSFTATSAICIFAAVTLVTYALLLAFASEARPSKLIESISDSLILPDHVRCFAIWTIGLLAIAISILHYVEFNGFTLSASMSADTNFAGALIRQRLTEDLPSWMLYLNSFAIKCLFPMGLLLAVVFRQRALATIVAVFGMLYAINMMQKSGPFMVALPTLVYWAVTFRFYRFVGGAISVCAVVLFMSFMANPDLQVAHQDENQQSKWQSSIYSNEIRSPPSDRMNRVIEGLFGRIALTPGNVVSQWFDKLPSQIPLGQGCGYRFLAPFLGCTFQNYSVVLYEKLYPEETARGLHGTVNAASMMTAYANFGMWGIVISAVLHGILAWGLYVIFARAPELSPSVNAAYLFFLSSSDLFTSIFSGGWGLAVLLFLLLARERSDKRCFQATYLRSCAAG